MHVGCGRVAQVTSLMSKAHAKITYFSFSLLLLQLFNTVHVFGERDQCVYVLCVCCVCMYALLSYRRSFRSLAPFESVVYVCVCVCVYAVSACVWFRLFSPDIFSYSVKSYGLRRVSIYCEFWLVNKLLLPLTYKEWNWAARDGGDIAAGQSLKFLCIPCLHKRIHYYYFLHA